LTVPGLLAGGIIALAAARIVGGMLVNVSASDPLTFASAAAFLGLVAALASYLPALRAMRVDPSSRCGTSSSRRASDWVVSECGSGATGQAGEAVPAAGLSLGSYDGGVTLPAR